MNTKTVRADILLKRGLRRELTRLRAGELGYIKDEKKIVLGTEDSIEDVAMRRELVTLSSGISEALKRIRRDVKEIKEHELSNKKVLERITNKDINDIRKIALLLESDDFVIMQREKLDELMNGGKA